MDDEVHDPTYIPPRVRQPGASVQSVRTTPSGTDNFDIPESQKRKVNLAAGPRCLIQRQRYSFEYCHVIGKKATNAELTNIEYYWKMPRYSLNLHSRYNLCVLSRDLHNLFDNKGLLFLPTKEVLEKYANHKVHTSLPCLPNDNDAQDRKFEYQLVAPRDMDNLDVAIIRRKDDDTKGSEAHFYDHHAFPYKTFPLISSHLLPHFVIYNAGKKVASRSVKFYLPSNIVDSNTVECSDLVARLEKVELLYYRWTRDRSPPSEWMERGPPPKRSAPSHSGKATTEARRPSKRRAKGQGSPTPSKRANMGGQSYLGQREQGQQAQDDLDGSTLLVPDSIQKLDGRSERQILNEKWTFIDKWRESIFKGLGAGALLEDRKDPVKNVC